MKLYELLSQWLRLPLAGPAFKLYARRRHYTNAQGSSAKRRILLVNLMPSLGDTICYMASLEYLRSAQPRAEIVWMADSAVADFVLHHPAIDSVLTIRTPPSWMLRIPTLKTYYRLFTIARSIQRLQLEAPFDIAIVLRGGADPSFSTHAIWMLNLPRSIGFSHRVEPAEAWHNFGDSLLTTVIHDLRDQHEAARPVQLFQVAGLLPAPSQPLNLDAPLRGLHTMASQLPVALLLNKIGAPSTSYVVIAPGASVPNRAWPWQNFRALCDLLLQHSSFNIILTGSPSEGELCEQLLQGLSKSRIYNSAGELSLLELTSLLCHAQAFVGNDSGAGHIAGALGTPVVSLHTQALDADPWHVRSPGKGRPLGSHVTVLQPRHFLSPCISCCEAHSSHCIAQITVDEVWQDLQLSLQRSLVR